MSETLNLVLRYITASAATATLVVADVYSWSLSAMTAGFLGGIAGWLVFRRPGDTKSE